LSQQRRTARSAKHRARLAPSPVRRWPLVFGRTSSLVTAAARARLPHTVRIFTGARTAETPAGVRVPGLSGRCASVFFRCAVRCAGDRNNRRQRNGSQHLDFRSHEKPSRKGRIIANGNVYAVGDPRCVPGFASAEIIPPITRPCKKNRPGARTRQSVIWRPVRSVATTKSQASPPHI
jgi:hypothetical protein